MTQDFARKKSPAKKKPKQKSKAKSHKRPSIRTLVSLSAFILFGSGLFYLYGIPPETKTTAQQAKGYTQLPKPKTVRKTKPDEPPLFTFYTKLRESQNWEAIEPVERRQNKPAKIPPTQKREVSRPTKKAPSQIYRAAKKSNAQYILQAGSFNRFEDANNQRVNLIMKGIRNVRITTVSLSGNKTKHRIEMGPFTSEQALNEVKDRLNGMKVSSFKRRIN